ncbi:hypothetical protein INT47_007215 [Mucor saturninus]|uniref:SET domain-containing protein n=1 Tax=Mucor saturninus TaxID=64648 RepID=A0A8H7V345_9FUNG|nr:hypothetical protein INT47_007215 [Mucor saturninus]
MNDLLEIAFLPGKGRGFKAKDYIPAGTTLHISHPLATTVSQEWLPETCQACFHFIYPKKHKVRAVTPQEQSLLATRWQLPLKKNSVLFKDVLFCSLQCKQDVIAKPDWELSLAINYRLDLEFARSTQTDLSTSPILESSAEEFIDIESDDALEAWLDHAWDSLTDNLDLHQPVEDSDRAMCRLIASCILRKNNEIDADIDTTFTTSAHTPQYKNLLVIQNNELSLFKSLYKSPITKLPKNPAASNLPQEILDVMALYSFFKRAVSQPLYHVPQLTHVNHQVFRAIFFRERANSFGLWEMGDEEIAKGTGGVSDDLELLGFGIYPSAVYFNHSCDANVIKIRDGNRMKFIARRMIDQDEEACISYGSVDDSLFVRRQRLFEHYHFTCACTKCVQEELYDDIIR